MSERFIGLIHRRKRTAEGEARPTRVVVIDPEGTTTNYDLENEFAEFDFVVGRLPTAYRPAEEADDVENFPRHWQLKKTRGKGSGFQVPCEFTGLKPGDQVATILGGSGSALTTALFRQGEKIGAKVWCLPSYELKQVRGSEEKDNDPFLLAKLLQDDPERFFPVTARSVSYLEVLVAYREWKDAQAARIAASQRLGQRLVGKLFLAVGLHPEAEILDRYQAALSSDKILEALETEEGRRERELEKLVKALPLFERLRERGIGIGTVAAIVAAVGNISRFPSRDGFVAYLGVHCKDGKLARRRTGEVANWVTTTRTALWNFVGISCNRNPDSFWGTRLRLNKERLRAKHPEVEIYTGTDGKPKKRYTDGHIHKMAIWRTATQVARWIYNQWTALERQGDGDPNLPVIPIEREPVLV